MKKGNKSNEISATCSCLYTLFFLAIKNPKDTHCRKEKKKRLHRVCYSLMLLLRNAVKACQRHLDLLLQIPIQLKIKNSLSSKIRNIHYVPTK